MKGGGGLVLGKNRRCQREMCEDQFRDSLQKDTVFVTEWTVSLRSPFLASLISFCTHPLPRVSNGPPTSPQNTPS